MDAVPDPSAAEPTADGSGRATDERELGDPVRLDALRAALGRTEVCFGPACWVHPRPTGLRVDGLSGSLSRAAAVAEGGMVVLWDGDRLLLERVSPAGDLWASWVSASGGVYVVGTGGLWARGDSTWEPVRCGVAELTTVHGASDVVFAGGPAGVLVVADASGCRRVPTPFVEPIISVYAVDERTVFALTSHGVVRVTDERVEEAWSASAIGVDEFRWIAGLDREHVYLATNEGAVLVGPPWRIDHRACPGPWLWTTRALDGGPLVASGGGCFADAGGWHYADALRGLGDGVPVSATGAWLGMNTGRLEVREVGATTDAPRGAHPLMQPLWVELAAAGGSLWLTGPGLHIRRRGMWTFAEIAEPPRSSQELLADITGLTAHDGSSAWATAVIGGDRGQPAALELAADGTITSRVDLPTVMRGIAIMGDSSPEQVMVGSAGAGVLRFGRYHPVRGTSRAELLGVCASPEGAWLTAANGGVFFVASGTSRARRLASGVDERLLACAVDTEAAWVVGGGGAVLRCSSTSCDRVAHEDGGLTAVAVHDENVWIFGGDGYAAMVTPDEVVPVDIGLAHSAVVRTATDENALWLLVTGSRLLRIGDELVDLHHSASTDDE